VSHTGRDLLVRGIAAAMGNSLDEARHYLEWVLRTDSTVEQEADAHYWLSRISTDPAQKRDHLESVLAVNPHYPEARRDLAILEGRLKPDEMVDHHRGVTPIKPGAEVLREMAASQKCPRCGAKMSARTGDGTPACQFCGYREGMLEGQGTDLDSIEEQDWIAAIYTRKGHAWVLPTARLLACEGCGARVSITPQHVSTECPFCGGAYVIREADADLVEPEGIVPFAFGAQEALGHARRWVTEGPFRPEDLGTRAAFSMPSPIFLPFWTFDLDGEVRWTRLVEDSDFGRKVVRREVGSELLGYDDLLAPATRSLSPDLLRELEFNTERLVPYRDEMLADLPAEIYSVSAADASLDALSQVRRDGRAQAQKVGKGGTVQVEAPRVSISSYKLILLPVWISHYAYGSQTFDVAVNGITGETHGDLPRNAVQRFLVGVLDGVMGRDA
jgi:predicted RNA-binding Zn-ribbon protein involved in translation (DUF1610 family)